MSFSPELTSALAQWSSSPMSVNSSAGDPGLYCPVGKGKGRLMSHFPIQLQVGVSEGVGDCFFVQRGTAMSPQRLVTFQGGWYGSPGQPGIPALGLGSPADAMTYCFPDHLSLLF